MVALLQLLWSRVVCAAAVFSDSRAGSSDRLLKLESVCVSRWLMHAAMLFIYFFSFVCFCFVSLSIAFYELFYRISPRVEQQGCFHSNREANDWQSMVSAVLLPNPQNKLPLLSFSILNLFFAKWRWECGSTASLSDLLICCVFGHQAILILNQEDRESPLVIARLTFIYVLFMFSKTWPKERVNLACL